MCLLVHSVSGGWTSKLVISLWSAQEPSVIGMKTCPCHSLYFHSSSSSESRSAWCSIHGGSCQVRPATVHYWVHHHHWQPSLVHQETKASPNHLQYFQEHLVVKSLVYTSNQCCYTAADLLLPQIILIVFSEPVLLGSPWRVLRISCSNDCDCQQIHEVCKSCRSLMKWLVSMVFW